MGAETRDLMILEKELAEVSSHMIACTDDGSYGFKGLVTDRLHARSRPPARHDDDVYYVLVYQPPAHDKPGYRKIRVDVRGKGLQVRARRGYFSGAHAPR